MLSLAVLCLSTRGADQGEGSGYCQEAARGQMASCHDGQSVGL